VTIRGAERDVGQLEAALVQIAGSNTTFNQSLRGAGSIHEQEKEQLKWVAAGAVLCLHAARPTITAIPAELKLP
jgi:hypothetical protein